MGASHACTASCHRCRKLADDAAHNLCGFSCGDPYAGPSGACTPSGLNDFGHSISCACCGAFQPACHLHFGSIGATHSAQLACSAIAQCSYCSSAPASPVESASISVASSTARSAAFAGSKYWQHGGSAGSSTDTRCVAACASAVLERAAPYIPDNAPTSPAQACTGRLCTGTLRFGIHVQAPRPAASKRMTERAHQCMLSSHILSAQSWNALRMLMTGNLTWFAVKYLGPKGAPRQVTSRHGSLVTATKHAINCVLPLQCRIVLHCCVQCDKRGAQDYRSV
jgi:hypothetical protein